MLKLTPATETEPGVERRVCDRCNTAQERSLPATGGSDSGCACKCVFFQFIVDFFRSFIDMFAAMFSSVC